MNENILENKIREVLPNDKVTACVNDRINKLKCFFIRLEKMDYSLSLEFLELIDNLILTGDLEKIILDGESNFVKIKKFGYDIDT